MRFSAFFFWIILLSCSNPDNQKELSETGIVSDEDSVSNELEGFDRSDNTEVALHDTNFVNLKSICTDFVYDMRYTTTNNFLKEAAYPCAECVLRKEVAEGLCRANQLFIQKGYKIKIFDCYRPLDVQKKMWEIYPNPSYVANPAKGSIHNRGGAVDITLVDSTGKQVDMGTAFDHFGKEAHHTYTALDESILAHRTILKSTMAEAGFSHLNSEWWHYNFETKYTYNVSNFPLDCEE